MNKIKVAQFPVDTVDTIMKHLEGVQVKGVDSITRMAMIFQLINENASVVEVEVEGENNGKK